MDSLLVSLGGTYEAMGETAQAEHYFSEAAEHGVIHYRGPVRGSCANTIVDTTAPLYPGDIDASVTPG